MHTNSFGRERGDKQMSDNYGYFKHQKRKKNIHIGKPLCLDRKKVEKPYLRSSRLTKGSGLGWMKSQNTDLLQKSYSLDHWKEKGCNCEYQIWVTTVCSVSQNPLWEKIGVLSPGNGIFLKNQSWSFKNSRKIPALADSLWKATPPSMNWAKRKLSFYKHKVINQSS